MMNQVNESIITIEQSRVNKSLNLNNSYISIYLYIIHPKYTFLTCIIINFFKSFNPYISTAFPILIALLGIKFILKIDLSLLYYSYVYIYVICTYIYTDQYSDIHIYVLMLFVYLFIIMYNNLGLVLFFSRSSSSWVIRDCLRKTLAETETHFEYYKA